MGLGKVERLKMLEAIGYYDLVADPYNIPPTSMTFTIYQLSSFHGLKQDLLKSASRRHSM